MYVICASTGKIQHQFTYKCEIKVVKAIHQTHTYTHTLRMCEQKVVFIECKMAPPFYFVHMGKWFWWWWWHRQQRPMITALRNSIAAALDKMLASCMQKVVNVADASRYRYATTITHYIVVHFTMAIGGKENMMANRLALYGLSKKNQNNNTQLK